MASDTVATMPMPDSTLPVLPSLTEFEPVTRKELKETLVLVLLECWKSTVLLGRGLRFPVISL